MLRRCSNFHDITVYAVSSWRLMYLIAAREPRRVKRQKRLSFVSFILFSSLRLAQQQQLTSALHAWNFSNASFIRKRCQEFVGTSSATRYRQAQIFQHIPLKIHSRSGFPLIYRPMTQAHSHGRAYKYSTDARTKN